jgi:hypothetical protein
MRCHCVDSLSRTEAKILECILETNIHTTTSVQSWLRFWYIEDIGSGLILERETTSFCPMKMRCATIPTIDNVSDIKIVTLEDPIDLLVWNDARKPVVFCAYWLILTLMRDIFRSVVHVSHASIDLMFSQVFATQIVHRHCVCKIKAFYASILPWSI